MNNAQFQLFDVLPAHIEDALTASIKRFGVLVPVTVDQNGTMLDGHHRARIADKLGVKYDRLVRYCADDDERREIARTLNADRRQLTEEQRRSVVASLAVETVMVRGEEVAKHTPNAIASALKVSLDTVQRDIGELTDDGKLNRPEKSLGLDGKVRPTRRPQVLTRDTREQERAQLALVAVGDTAPPKTLDLKRVERIAREDEATRRRIELVQNPPEALSRRTDGVIDLRIGDFRTVFNDVESGTVDAIITDPPYPREFWDLYGPLGELAAQLLHPGGILAVMTGTRLDMVDHVDAAIRQHMTPRHRGIYLTPGPRWRDNTARVAIGYKPILIYTHPDADTANLPWILDDVFASVGDDKAHHHWGQSESGMASIVERLTQPGQLVCDPFTGGGTTAVVCQSLGRAFLGCDVDPLAVDTTRGRLQ